MQLLLGYIGVINGIGLLPIAIKVAFFDDCPPSSDDGGGVNAYPLVPDISSSCEKISAIVLLYLVGKALADNVLSDYLWARAVVLTSATVGTSGCCASSVLSCLLHFLRPCAQYSSRLLHLQY